MRVAAIDVGTNSCHLLIAEVTPEGRISVVDKLREQVELGAGEFQNHRITETAFARGIEAMRRFKQRCDSYEVEDIHAAATSAVREAENGAEFCREVKHITGIHVRIISGLDEARIIYLGTRAHIDFSVGRVMLFDLGGGSTEFVLCDAEQALVMESLPIGHIRLADSFLQSDPLNETDRRALKSEVQTLLRPLVARVRSTDFHSLVGTSGTVRNLARMATLLRGDAPPEHENGLILKKDELEQLIRLFRSRPANQWPTIPGFDPKRKGTIVVGAIVIREILKALGKDQLVSSEHSLRDGLIVDWILRHRPELDISKSIADPRRRSVFTTLNRYGADLAHAQFVATTALQIFDATVHRHHGSVEDRRLLEFSALLHDIGHYISGKDHHRHGYYLIQHTPLSGFTAPEIAVLGNIVRYHRGKPKERHPEFAALSSNDRQRTVTLSAILRMADALDRGHHQNVYQLQIVDAPKGLHLTGLTRESPDLEHWAAVECAEVVESILNCKVFVDLHRESA